MGDMIVGGACGLFVGSILIAFTSVALLTLARKSTEGSTMFLAKYRGPSLIMSTALIGNVVCATGGILLGLVYHVLNEQFPVPGLGSPNVIYTGGVVIATVLLVIPIGFILKRVLAGVLTFAAVLAGVFGWVLPLLAT